VARYNEDVAWLAASPHAGLVWLYDKGGSEFALDADVTVRFGKHLPLRNVGNEAYSYLRFILHSYDAP